MSFACQLFAYPGFFKLPTPSTLSLYLSSSTLLPDLSPSAFSPILSHFLHSLQFKRCAETAVYEAIKRLGGFPTTPVLGFPNDDTCPADEGTRLQFLKRSITAPAVYDELAPHIWVSILDAPPSLLPAAQAVLAPANALYSAVLQGPPVYHHPANGQFPPSHIATIEFLHPLTRYMDYVTLLSLADPEGAAVTPLETLHTYTRFRREAYLLWEQYLATGDNQNHALRSSGKAFLMDVSGGCEGSLHCSLLNFRV